MISEKELLKIQKTELEMLLEIDRICRKNNLNYYLGYGTVLGAIRHKGFIPWDSDVDILVDIDSYDKFCKILEKEMSFKYKIYSIKNDSEYELLFARVCLRNQEHYRIHIDIYPLVGTPKSKIGRKIFTKIAYLNYKGYYGKKIKLKNKYIQRKKLALLVKIILFPLPSKFFIWLFNKLSTMFSIADSEVLYNICGSYGDKELIPKSYFGIPVYVDFEGYKFPVPKEWHKYLTHIYGDYMTPKRSNYIS